MHLSDILKENRVHFSFEFFPPKTEEASRALFETIGELSPIQPSFVSVTYGAGGATNELTQNLVTRLKQETPLNVVAHLTATGASREKIKSQLEKYIAAGIRNVLALRGDPPKGNSSFTPAPMVFVMPPKWLRSSKNIFRTLAQAWQAFQRDPPKRPTAYKRWTT